jgi:hypothetical protein
MIEFTNNTKKIMVNTKPQVVIQSKVRIHGLGTLPVEIIGDFTNIPEQYHELFIQGMLVAYNPEPKAPIEKDDRSFLRWLFDSITFNTKEK